MLRCVWRSTLHAHPLSLVRIRALVLVWCGAAKEEDTRDDAITQLYNLHAFALFEHKKVTVIVAGEGVDATVVEGPADRVLLLADDRLCAGREGTGKGAGGHRPSEITST